MADDSAVQQFLDEVREIFPNRAMRFGYLDGSAEYQKLAEWKANKEHLLDIAGIGQFKGTHEVILKAVQAKAKWIAELMA